MDYFHFVFVLRGYFGLLLDESVGSLGGIAQFKDVVDLGVEDFEHAEMHPLPEDSSRIVHFFIVNAYLQLFPEIHGGQPL